MAARWFTLLALLVPAEWADRPPGPVADPEPEWLSEPEYRIGDAMAGDALFGSVPYLRVTPDGRRVFVLEPNQARVSVWTPGGRLLLDLGGPGEGPGDFMLPYRIHLGDSWFYVRDQSRFTYFSYGGKVLKTVPNPPTSVGYQGFPVRVHALLADGSFLGRPSVPASIRVGLWGDDPFDRMPVLRIWESGDGWSQKTVAWRSIQNGTLVVVAGGGISYSAQPYSDTDIYWEDPGSGSVVFARRTGEHLGPGEAELLEVSAAGDTVWKRRLGFEPTRLTRPMVEAAIDEWSSVTRPTPFPRDAVERALHTPEYVPAVKVFYLASSGHVWIQSHERRDTLRVWYSLERRDNETPPRRVLLPEWFQVLDATDTHVWGVWKDELDINYVVGRRLVPAS